MFNKKYFGKLSESDEEPAVPYIVMTSQLYLILRVNASRCVRLQDVKCYQSQARNAVIIEILKKGDLYVLVRAWDSLIKAVRKGTVKCTAVSNQTNSNIVDIKTQSGQDYSYKQDIHS